MREIKFRGKRKDNDEWIYGKNIHYLYQGEDDFLTCTMYKSGQKYMALGDGYITSRPLIVDIKTVGQYTGLKDKNGKEIYEGDIVSSFSNINKITDPHLTDGEPNYSNKIIEFYNGAFRLTSEKYPHGCGILNNNGGSMAKDLEVIGNIYKSLELIKS